MSKISELLIKQASQLRESVEDEQASKIILVKEAAARQVSEQLHISVEEAMALVEERLK